MYVYVCYTMVQYIYSVSHTENVARGAKLSFQNVGGGGAKVNTFKSVGGQDETLILHVFTFLILEPFV